MNVTVKRKSPGQFVIDVSGMLPWGEFFRKRTTQRLSSESAARKYGENVWKAALEKQLNRNKTTVEEYAKQWLESRKKRGLSSAETNRYQLEHVLPHIGNVELQRLTRNQIRDTIEHMKKFGQVRRGTGRVAPRTVRHTYGTLRTMLADAVHDGLIPTNPATLRAHRDEVPRIRDKDPEWRRTAVFDAGELERLISHPDISERRRVSYALGGLAGLRLGEASALRWSHWLRNEKPLTGLDVRETYDSNNDRLKCDKTDNPRRVPAHARLGAMLEHWHEVGWKQEYGRAPKADDLIIPWKDGRRLICRHKNDAYHEHVADLKLLELRHRRQHDLRRTFITLARAGGADKEWLKWVSHGPPKNVILDDYTSPPWELLCRVVDCLKVGIGT